MQLSTEISIFDKKYDLDFSVAVASDFNKGGTWNGAIENIKNSWVPLCS